MKNKYSILEIFKFIFSIFGFLGSVIVYLLISINSRYLGNTIENLTLFNVFLIFAFFCLITIFLDRVLSSSKVRNRLGRYSLRVAYVGLLINGFGIITDLPGYLYWLLLVILVVDLKREL